MQWYRGVIIWAEYQPRVKFLAELPLEDSDSIYRGFIHQESYVKKAVSQYRSELLSTNEHPEKPEEQLTYRLITSLLDIEKFPAELLARVYAQRWEVENTIDELKIHHRARKTHVRSQKPRSVVQEVYGWLLGRWAVRVLMFQAATSALCCSIAPK